MPTSFATAVWADLGCARMDVMKPSGTITAFGFFLGSRAGPFAYQGGVRMCTVYSMPCQSSSANTVCSLCSIEEWGRRSSKGALFGGCGM
jgi:hypothetical protein